MQIINNKLSRQVDLVQSSEIYHKNVCKENTSTQMHFTFYIRNPLFSLMGERRFNYRNKSESNLDNLERISETRKEQECDPSL